MKAHVTRAIACIIFSLIALVGHAQEKEYVVCVRNSLPVYMSQRVKSEKVGEIADQSIIQATQTKDKDWMQVWFNNSKRYVQSRYLVEYNPSNYPYRISRYVNQVVGNIHDKIKASPIRFTSKLPYLFVLILGLTLMLGWDLVVFIGKKRLEKNHFNMYCAGFIMLLMLELYCMLFYEGSASWFCSPDNVGWILAGICFIIFVGITLNQLLVSVMTIQEMDYNTSRFCNYNIGLYSYGVAIVAYILTSWFCKLDYDGLILSGLLLCQIVQMGIIVVKHLEYKSFDIELVLSLLLYASITITMPFLFLECLIRVGQVVGVVLGIMFLLYLFSSNGSSQCCGNCRTYSGGYCHYRNKYVNSGDSHSCWESRH